MLVFLRKKVAEGQRHTVDKKGGKWYCNQCGRKHKSWTTLMNTKCEGSLLADWQFQSLGGPTTMTGVGRKESRHLRFQSGNITWRAVCGAYAEKYARSLKQACPGQTAITGRKGRERQHKDLWSGFHPRRRHERLEPPVPLDEDHKVNEEVATSYTRVRARALFSCFAGLLACLAELELS